MYRSIVVGTDGSQTAGRAVEHATAIAKAFGAVLHVVSAYKPAAAALAAPEMAAATVDLDNAAREHMSATLARAIEDASRDGVKAESHAGTGDPSDVICEIAENVGADLIIVGNKGMTGARRFLLGSVPNRISHHSPCSVLIVQTT